METKSSGGMEVGRASAYHIREINTIHEPEEAHSWASKDLKHASASEHIGKQYILKHQHPTKTLARIDRIDYHPHKWTNNDFCSADQIHVTLMLPLYWRHQALCHFLISSYLHLFHLRVDLHHRQVRNEVIWARRRREVAVTRGRQ